MVRGTLGKTGVTADRDKIEFRLFNSSSIFNITLREELLSSPKQKISHGSSFCFHGASRLSRAPWSEVDDHPFPGDEPSVTLAQLHSELSSRASTTTKDSYNKDSNDLLKMGWISSNWDGSPPQNGMDQTKPTTATRHGRTKSACGPTTMTWHGMDYEDCQTSSRSAKLQTSRLMMIAFIVTLGGIM